MGNQVDGPDGSDSSEELGLVSERAKLVAELEAKDCEITILRCRVEWLERLHLYREDGHSDVHDGMARP